MVRFTSCLLPQPLAVPPSTSPPRPGLPAGPVAHTMRRPPRECGREPKRPSMSAHRSLFSHCQDRRETCRLTGSASLDLKHVPCSSVYLLTLPCCSWLTDFQRDPDVDQESSACCPWS